MEKSRLKVGQTLRLESMGRILRIYNIDEVAGDKAFDYKAGRSFDAELKEDDLGRLFTNIDVAPMYNSFDIYLNDGYVSSTKFTPEAVEELLPNQIFVFGSNLHGQHDGGAARLAYEKFGASYFFSEGLMGRSYALPTLGYHMEKLSHEDIHNSIIRLYQFAMQNPDLTFLVTKVGCGIAGFKEAEMSYLFQNCGMLIPRNVILPKEFSVDVNN